MDGLRRDQLDLVERHRERAFDRVVLASAAYEGEIVRLEVLAAGACA